MPYGSEEIVSVYAAGAATYPNGKPTAAARDIFLRTQRAASGSPPAKARVHDSARREWIVEPSRDPERGRLVVFRPAHGDNEPFRASADGYRPAAFLPIGEVEWTVLALLAEVTAEGHADEELATAASRLADRMVREAQHRSLMGASEDEDDEG